MNDFYVSRWPDGDSPLNIKYCRELDFNNYELVFNGTYFVNGKTRKEGDWLQLKCLIDGKICYRRLYLSVTEIGRMRMFMRNKPDYNLDVYTDLYWPRMFFKDWYPTSNNEGPYKSQVQNNVFEYSQVEKLTIDYRIG